MECPVCHSKDTYLKYPSSAKDVVGNYKISAAEIGKHSDIYQCRECQLGFVGNNDFISRLVQNYNSDTIDEIYEIEERGRKKTAKRILATIDKYKGGKKLLDVGCYTGIFLSCASIAGYDTVGIEASPKAVAIAHKKGLLSVQLGLLEEYSNSLADNSFDVITLLDVIEHMSDPQKVLRILYKKLKPSGIIFLSTPNFLSFLSRLQKERWYAVVPHHIYYFSYKNLEHILIEVGFKILNHSTQTRFFSTSYILTRIKPISFLLYSFLLTVNKLLHLKHIIWPINLRDQLVIIARK